MKSKEQHGTKINLKEIMHYQKSGLWHSFAAIFFLDLVFYLDCNTLNYVSIIIIFNNK